MAIKARSKLDYSARALRIGRNKAFSMANLPYEKGFIMSPNGDIISDVGSNLEKQIFLTDEQYKQVEGNILVHNHPVERSFSANDIINASPMHAIWVVTPKRIESFAWDTQKPMSERMQYLETFKNAWKDVSDRAKVMRDKLYPVSILKDASGRATDAFRKSDGSVDKVKVDKWVEERKEAYNTITNRLWRNWLRKNQKKYGYRFSSVGWENEQKKYN